LEGTQKLIEMKKHWKRWGMILVIIGMLLLMWGIWKAIEFGE